MDIERDNWIIFEEGASRIRFSFIVQGHSERRILLFLEVLWLHLVKYIPRRQLDIVKKSHPWMNDKRNRTSMETNRIEGTSGYKEASVKCAIILPEEKCNHVQKLKKRIATQPPFLFSLKNAVL